jgi:hypothetical protein
MNGSQARGVVFSLALAVAFAAGRLWPPTEADAADPAPVELVHDGQLLWATATDPDRQILVVGWAKEDWAGLPEETPLFFLPKSGPLGLPVPVAVESIDGAMAYELRPVGIWDADLGFRPCVGDPIACDWIPLPPLPPRPPKMLTLGIVPAP